MPGAELQTSVRDDYVIVALRGELDVTGAAAAEAAITALMTWGRIVIIDMSVLDFIDCASISALLRVQRLAWSICGNVVLAAPQRTVRRLLALTGKDQAFWVHASVQAAVTASSSLGARGGSGSSVSTPAARWTATPASSPSWPPRTDAAETKIAYWCSE